MNRARKVKHITHDDDILSRLVRWKIPFTVTLTGATRTIDCERTNTKYICSEEKMKFSTLGFISQIKKYASECSIYNNYSSKDVNYFRFANIQPGLYKGYIEVDVNQAYWNLAKKYGYLSDEGYQKGMEVDKKDRLIAFGSLATVKHNFQFDGNEIKRVGEGQFNPKTRSYFFHVARELDLIMSDVFELYERHILWYWVDAFFVSKRAQGFVRSRVKKFGLDCKVKEVSHIECFMQNQTKVVVVTMESGEEKPFFIKPKHRVEEDLYRFKNHVDAVKEEVCRKRQEFLSIIKNLENG